ncbi:MAG: peptide chain release factor 1 [Spirochaetes bacterium]|jgi:peptide chain release factor 1|nr:peptide chain release factor 1 [Spirochaetota bacterium]MBP8991287.1 peptide chain release factor 1 [Spirochaetota bacterium]NLJ04474.1 peptide chain release factor 1 [Exilispira sp.]HOV46012.1 peptide chain release factor 1 [Exilispira sp.]HQQ19978.1 peptide chain release factor 1 [Exilispira sp.]
MDKFEEKVDGILRTYNDIQDKLATNEVLEDRNLFKELSKKKASMDEIVEKIEEYKNCLKNIAEAKQIIESSNDKDLVIMAQEELKNGEIKVTEIQQEIKYLLLPKDENAGRNVIVEIRAGTGGEEAALFAADLFRMYSRYAERKKWKLEILSMSESEMQGFKEIIFSVSGENVYSFMKYEAGVHRVQRVPETEAAGRIHTSAVSVVVLPEVEETEVNIDPKDLRIDVYRASGHGGQHVNKTESAVRITHIPTNLSVVCQDEKSQLKNKDRAMKILRSRIYELYEAEKNKNLSEERKAMIKTGDRSDKIRTYNYPQSRVTDHRINFTIYKLEQFMDGDIQDMIDALIMDEKERLLSEVEF